MHLDFLEDRYEGGLRSLRGAERRETLLKRVSPVSLQRTATTGSFEADVTSQT
jgi:hypothetical protein